LNEQGGVKTHFVQIIEAVTNALTYYLNAGECRTELLVGIGFSLLAGGILPVMLK